MSRDSEPSDGLPFADAAARRRRTLLVVDDNQSIRESLSMLFSLAGYRVAQATDGAEALALIENERPDVVVTDIRMPGISGEELIRLIRSSSILHDLPIVAVSVHGPRGLEGASVAGANALVDKLADFEELLRAVRICLDPEQSQAA